MTKKYKKHYIYYNNSQRNVSNPFKPQIATQKKKKNFKKYIYRINIPGTLTFPTFREVASKTTNYVFLVLWHHVLLLLIWL